MKKSLIFLAFVCVVLIGICAWQARELAARKQRAIRAEAALQEEQRIRAEQETAAQYLERREREWKDKAMQLSALVGTLRSSQPTQGSNYTGVPQASAPALAGAGQTNEAAGAPGGMFGKGMGAMLSKMMKDPNMKEMMRAQQKMALKKMYGPLIADLKLPPDQQQKLNDLLLDQQMQTLERSQEMFKEDGVDMKKMASIDTVKANEAAIQEVLGPEKFEEFQEYKKTMTERMQLGEIKELLQETGSPLRDDQTKQMLVMMKEERERYPPVFDANAGGGKNLAGMFEDGAMERQMEWQEDLNRRVQERLAPVLSPEQLKAYTDLQAQQLSMQKFGMKMAREMFGKGVPGPGANPVVVPAPVE